MTALASLLFAFASTLSPCQPADVWCWDAVPSADGYVWMWSREPDRWSECLAYDVGAATYFNDDALGLLYGVNGLGVVYTNVLSYNSAGTSPSDHGTIEPCPIEVCP